MSEIFISPRNFWSSDGREALGLSQGVRVGVILEFRIIWAFHWQTLISNKCGDWLNTQEGVLGAKVMEEGVWLVSKG